MGEPPDEAPLQGDPPLLDALGDGLLVLAPETGTVLAANAAAADCFGTDPEGDRLADHLRGDLDLSVPVDARRRVVWELPAEESSPPGTPAAGSDMTSRHLEATLTVTERGGREVLLATLRDVTDRVARERSLEQHERVVATMPDGVFVVDEAGQMVGGNEAMAAMIGEEMAALKGKPFAELVEDGILAADVLERYAEVVGDLMAGSDHEMVEIEVTPPGEATRVYECHVTLRPPDDGPFTGIVGVARDVTERVESQAALRRQNERLEQFASVVSHDLRNPLNVLQGRLELYEETGEPGQLADALAAADRMDGIIADLLTLAREGADVGATTEVSLADIAAEAWSFVASDGAALAATDARFEADPDRLGQALENLFANAIEHGGADVTVTVGPLGDPDDPAGFHVADDGVGLPEALTDSLFDRGVSAAEEGTGFGLAIVERIVEAHGWTITAAEGDDGGARFEVRF